MDKYLIYIFGGLMGLSFLLIIINHIRLHGMIKKYKKLIKGLSDVNIEELMTSYSAELDQLKNNISGNVETRILTLENKMQNCLKNIGIVSYNAFKNIGNNMSFSIAALDDKKDGFVLTGIYTRENSYVYTKEIHSGKSQKELSSEEEEALKKAKSLIK